MEATQGATARLLDQWKKLNKSLKWALIAIVVLVIALIAVIALGSSGTEYEILYAGLDPDAATQVYTLLQDVNVPYRIEGTSKITILIPKGQREEMLLRLRQEGYPSTDADLYSYFNNLGLGTTDFDKKVSYQIQLEQRIAYGLKQMDKIKNAVVNVTIAEQPRYALGSQNNIPAQASIILALNAGEQLSSQEADAVRSHVVDSVSQLAPENVTITDTNMHRYRMSGSESAGGGYSEDPIELRNQAQQLIQEQVYNILTPVFGPGYVKASAAVELDFDSRSTQSVTYEPPGSEDNMGIIVSLRQTASQVQGTAAVGGVVGFDPNGAAPFYPENWTGTADSPYYQYTQELNAEVNEVREQVTSQRGKFKSIDVAVTIDAGDAGDEWEAQIDTLRAHIAAAVGVAADNISVMISRFKTNVDMEAFEASIPEPDTQPETDTSILIYAIAGGVVLLFAFIVFMIIRSNKKKRKALEAQIARIEEENRLIGARQIAEAQQVEMQTALMEDDPAKVRLGEIQNLADEKPDVVAQLLRNWLTDDYGR